MPEATVRRDIHLVFLLKFVKCNVFSHHLCALRYIYKYRGESLPQSAVYIKSYHVSETGLGFS